MRMSAGALLWLLFIAGCGSPVVDEGPPPSEEAAELTEEEVAAERDLADSSGEVNEDL